MLTGLSSQSSEASSQRKIMRILHPTQLQRETKRLATMLGEGAIALSERLAAAKRLLQIAENAAGKAEVIRRLSSRSKQKQQIILGGLFTLADYETPIDTTLSPSSQSAKLIKIVLKQPHFASDIFTAYLGHPGATEGAAGVRFALKYLPSGWDLHVNPQRILVHYATSILQSHPSEQPPSRSWHHAMRLLELLIRTHGSSELKIFTELKTYLRHDDAATRSAVLQLIRAATSSYLPPALLDDDLVQILATLAEGSAETNTVRCLALSALTSLLQYGSTTMIEEPMLCLCVDVLLWKTVWQHDHKFVTVSLPNFFHPCPELDFWSAYHRQS